MWMCRSNLPPSLAPIHPQEIHQGSAIIYGMGDHRCHQVPGPHPHLLFAGRYRRGLRIFQYRQSVNFHAVRPAQENDALVAEPLEVLHPAQLGGVLLFRAPIMNQHYDRQVVPRLLPRQLQQ
jgi:hypothetical protein